MALQEWIENPKEAEPHVAAAAPAGRRWLPWAAALVAGGLGLLAGATLLGRQTAPPEPVRRFEINLTEDSVFSRLGSGQWLPDGRAVLFTVRSNASADYESASIELVRVDTGERKVVHRGGYYARYVPTGHVLYVQNGTLFALPFDAQRLEATGSQMPVLEGLETNPAEGSAQYGVSDNGLLTYLPRAEGLAPFTIATADREGRAQPLWKAPGIYGGPHLSPDGRSLVVFRGPFLGGIRGLLLPGFSFPDYDVSGDGRRFVMFTGGGSKRTASRARVVLSWFDELKRLTSAGGR